MLNVILRLDYNSQDETYTFLSFPMARIRSPLKQANRLDDVAVFKELIHRVQRWTMAVRKRKKKAGGAKKAVRRKSARHPRKASRNSKASKVRKLIRLAKSKKSTKKKTVQKKKR